MDERYRLGTTSGDESREYEALATQEDLHAANAATAATEHHTKAQYHNQIGNARLADSELRHAAEANSAARGHQRKAEHYRQQAAAGDTKAILDEIAAIISRSFWHRHEPQQAIEEAFEILDRHNLS